MSKRQFVKNGRVFELNDKGEVVVKSYDADDRCLGFICFDQEEVEEMNRLYTLPFG